MSLFLVCIGGAVMGHALYHQSVFWAVVAVYVILMHQTQVIIDLRGKK